MQVISIVPQESIQMAMLRGGSNYTQQGYGERAALFGIPQEQVTRINPDAAVNIGLQHKLIVNYLANTYAFQRTGGRHWVRPLLPGSILLELQVVRGVCSSNWEA